LELSNEKRIRKLKHALLWKTPRGSIADARQQIKPASQIKLYAPTS